MAYLPFINDGYCKVLPSIELKPVHTQGEHANPTQNSPSQPTHTYSNYFNRVVFYDAALKPE